MKPEQKYATRKFYSLKSAESFKKKVGSNFNIKELKPETFYDLRIRYAVRFKIDKTKPKKHNINSGNDNFERFWKD